MGRPPAPHDLWVSWNLDPMLLGGLFLAVVLYARGRMTMTLSMRLRYRWKPFYLGCGVLALVLALVSPVDALAGSLASVHMVQHMLLVLVAAPLLALSAPVRTMIRGMPMELPRHLGRWRRALRSVLALARLPIVAWLLPTATLWFWHASVPYGTALGSEMVHIVEHASFLGTGILFWWVIIGADRSRGVGQGAALLMVFALAMPMVILGALMTFASSPWYPSYEVTAPVWGLSALADQHLAGVIMWVPGGLVHVGAAVALLASWIRGTETSPAHAGSVRSFDAD